jgi:hypothetical protein
MYSLPAISEPTPTLAKQGQLALLVLRLVLRADLHQRGDSCKAKAASDSCKGKAANDSCNDKANLLRLQHLASLLPRCPARISFSLAKRTVWRSVCDRK